MTPHIRSRVDSLTPALIRNDKIPLYVLNYIFLIGKQYIKSDRGHKSSKESANNIQRGVRAATAADIDLSEGHKNFHMPKVIASSLAELMVFSTTKFAKTLIAKRVDVIMLHDIESMIRNILKIVAKVDPQFEGSLHEEGVFMKE